MEAGFSASKRLLMGEERESLTAVGILVLRVGTGLALLLYHGWHKVGEAVGYFRLGDDWLVLADVRGMGMPFPVALAVAATLTQFLGSLSLIAGLLTRLAAAMVLGTLAVAILQTLQTGKDSQLPILYCLLCSALMLLGGGRHSVDARLLKTHS